MQLERDVLDFVEKDRTPVSKFKSSDPALDRACKSAFLVPEHLTFKQPGWNRSAVHPDQSPLPAPAQIVNCPGDQFFSSPGFTINQNGRVSGGNRFHFL